MIQSNDPAVGASKAGKFLLGKLVATPGAVQAMARSGQDPAVLLTRHRNADWGDVCKEDREANDMAIFSGDHLLSAYHLPDGTKVWVVTEGDKSATTILLPTSFQDIFSPS